MKIRSGFVSNSSSSSFVLDKDMMTEEQIELVKNYREYGPKIFKIISENKELMTIFTQDRSDIEDYELCSGGWDIRETSSTLELETNMDNFNMELYLEMLRIDPEAIG